MTDGTDEAYSRFNHFLHRAGFDPSQWSLAIESGGHERGIRATRNISITKPATNTTPPSHHPIISIPASLLITPQRVRSSSFARSLLSASGLASLSAEQLLVLWLVYQRRQGEHSSAYPYIRLLPQSYSSLEWWTEAEARFLPHSADSAATVEVKDGGGEVAGQDDPVAYHRSVCSSIRAQWQQLNALLAAQHPSLQPCQHDQLTTSHSLPLSVRQCRLPPSGHPLCPTTTDTLSCLIGLAEYQWAYSTVSTRSCYWPEDGSCCLIPFLDMLNHSSDIVCSCHYNPSTRLYSLYTQHKPTSDDPAAPLLHVGSGSEVYISYGALSNWQLLVRYGFVPDANVDEKDEMSVVWLESFMQRRCSSKDGRAVLRGKPVVQGEAVVRKLSDVRCCCDQTVLWQSLVTLRPCVGTTAQLPHVPSLSSKHSRLLSLCGLYSPSAFSLTCCAAGWDLMTYIKCRTVPLPSPAATQLTTDTLQGWADAILNDGWVDEQHERRGRELMAAVLLERMGRGGQQDSDASLLQQMDELAAWRSKQEQTAVGGGRGSESSGEGEFGSAGGGVEVSVLCRVLSGQFRVARRRMLLGALQHQLDAIQRL